jgi:hypothetical protein
MLPKSGHKDLYIRTGKLQLHEHKGRDIPRSFYINTRSLLTRQHTSGQYQGFELNILQPLTLKLDIVEKSFDVP